MRVDEILDALPGVGLQLWMLTWQPEGTWMAVVYDPTSPMRGRHEYEGAATPLEALVEALHKAGVNVTDA